ncbi:MULTISPECIES: DUF4437 domain-containing protein [unclassified Streptomyces]|uniref:DUF4437 domain-containing protein n=1 Tax=unclassified Streptomyces TaxID=2593676 RepID=UPI002E265DAA
MRPHVELIHEDDYVWHPAELPYAVGEIRERRLSGDEEDGSAALSLAFGSPTRRAAGVPSADTEFFVLEGRLRHGTTDLGPGGYLHVPKGVPMEELSAEAGSRVLHWREYGPSDFEPGGTRWPDASGDVTEWDSGAMEWITAPTNGPLTPLYIKLLHRDEKTGFYTRLVLAPKGWTDHRLAHHPCYEEFYTLSGRMTYNFGDIDPGTYCFRPPFVKHGHFVAEEDTTWIIRSDGELINWYTTDEWIKWGGEAENYEPHHAPVPSTLPIRSRSRGDWDSDGM